MATKQKPCTLAAKHSWTHVKNVTVTHATYGPNGSHIRISWRGRYKCACGAVRLGITRDEPAADAEVS